MSSRRRRSTSTPKPIARSSPVIMTDSGRASSRATGTSTRIADRANPTSPQVVALNEPANHWAAVWAALIDAFTMSSAFTADRIDAIPMPTSTRRAADSFPLLKVSAYTARAAPAPPSNAPTAVAMGEPSRTMIVTTAPVAEPVVNPMMSGLPSVFPDNCWKMQPDTPRAAPTAMVAMTRGSRWLWTKNWPK